jgi:vitamin K-dependent gamma-carboxylase
MPNMSIALHHERPRRGDYRGALMARLLEPVDIASIVFFRVALGALLLLEVWRYFRRGWIESVFIAPTFHFKYIGFEWVHPWPGIGMYFHFLLLGALAILVLIGYRYRLAILLFSIGFCYVLLLDRAHYLNHFYLICLLTFLMAFVPAHWNFSVDAWKDPKRKSNFVPAWSLWALRLQIAIPYVYGGIAKFNGDWLHGQPMQMWMSRMESIRTIVPIFGEPWLAWLASYCGLLIDLLVVPFLLWRRTRSVAFLVAVTFHLLNSVMFRIGVFPWLMICATTLFLSPDWPRRVFRVAIPKPIATDKKEWNRHLKLTSTVLSIFFIAQLVLPFRHWLYPGDVDWTDEGSRFAWRMMLCDKAGALRFTLVDPELHRTTAVDPREMLTQEQLVRLSREPQMQHEFARFLKQNLENQGRGRIEVRVFSLCSLNGRKAQLLVDPHIDLGAQPRSLLPSRWIVPLTEPLPREPWLVPLAEWEEHIKRK